MILQTKNTIKVVSFLWIGSVLGALFAFLSQITLARNLGPNQFGMFSAILATVTLVTPLAGAGVAQYWLLTFGAKGWNAKSYLNSSAELVIASSFLFMLILFLWAFVGPHSDEARLLHLLLSFYMVGLVANEILITKLQLEEKYLSIAVWNTFPHAVRFILVLILSCFFEQETLIYFVAIGYLVVSLILMLFSINEFKKMKSKNFLLKGHGARTKYFSTGIRPKDVLKDSWPFSFAAFFYFVYFQSDVILVKYFVGDAEAGLYNVAFTILAAIYIFPNVVYQKFLMPKIHRWASNDRLMFRRVYVKGNQWMLIIGLVFMLIAWFVIPFFVPFFFGVEYGESNKYLKILIVSVPIMFVASSAGAAMTTSSHMKIKIKFMGIVAILNVLLNLIAIPKYGAAGAAYVTVISNSLLLSLYLYGAEVFVFNDTKNGFIN